MEYVSLEVTLISAQDLDDMDPYCGFSPTSSMEVYAIVYVVIGDDIYAMQRTPPDDAGGNNPTWRFTARFVVPRDGSHLQNLHFSLRCRSPRGDYGVGDVMVSVEELLRLASQSVVGACWGAKFLVSHPVTTPWGWRRGTLRFRFRYGEKAARCKDAAAAEHSLEWSPTRLPSASAPLPLTAYEACPPYWTLPRQKNKAKLVSCLLMALVGWLLLLLLLLLSHILYEVPLAGPLPPPLPVILVYGCPALQPPVPPPAAAVGARFRWPAILLLGGLLAVIHLPCCTCMLVDSQLN